MTAVCLQFSNDKSRCRDPEIFEAQGEHQVISHHIVAYFVRGAANKLAPSVREMGLDAAQSFILPEHPAYFPGTQPDFLPVLPSATLEFCVSLWRRSGSHFLPTLPAAISHSQLSLFLENFYPVTAYFASLLLKSFPSFSSKAGPTNLWLQGHHPWLL